MCTVCKQERLGRSGRVGGDSRLASITEWQVLSGALQREGLQLIDTPTLLDQMWTDEPDPARRRPEFSRIVANLHMIEYTGKSGSKGLEDRPVFIIIRDSEDPSVLYKRTTYVGGFIAIITMDNSACLSSGASWRDKVSVLRTELKALGADAMVVTALDEVT